MLRPESGEHSPDARWWWNGTRWVPAFAESGQLWWNGSSWTRVAPRWPGVVATGGGALLLLIGLLSMTFLGLVAMGEPVNGVDENPPWWEGAALASIAAIVGGAVLFLVGACLLATRTHLPRSTQRRRAALQ